MLVPRKVGRWWRSFKSSCKNHDREFHWSKISLCFQFLDITRKSSLHPAAPLQKPMWALNRSQTYIFLVDGGLTRRSPGYVQLLHFQTMGQEHMLGPGSFRDQWMGQHGRT
ncbi:uncharacterized protein LOC108806735 [Raphanus sativus]|uniref:Uncharacterized protein LOC108806735 n=1 Tax=Raphanus sativus TaxID=3726 RepID=A0A6J0JHU3_RAPSA|nr:uncharacterized protein LOC108806735 [Raphanus sativus]